MSKEDGRYAKLKQEFRNRIEGRDGSILDVIEKPMTMDERLALLDELGRNELVERFKEWRPRTAQTKKRGAPLDQRVAISVTMEERKALDDDVRRMQQDKSVSTMSQFIRNRAIGSVDIQGWREKAVAALVELEEANANQNEMRKRKIDLIVMIEEEDGEEDVVLYQSELRDIQHKLDKIIAQNKRRSQRLTGRMSMAEAETVKHRASKLGISVSDYLRMMIFALEPDSAADAHMSYESKVRFYMSIIDVADNGWGEVPKIYNCTQCENYLQRIGELEELLKQNNAFGDA